MVESCSKKRSTGEKRAVSRRSKGVSRVVRPSCNVHCPGVDDGRAGRRHEALVLTGIVSGSVCRRQIRSSP